MTGSKRNNQIKNQKSKIKNESGQVLLITIMLLATALTVALSVSFKSTTETQVTKLEEESQKALAAAEAGIEAALKQGDIANIGGLSGDLSGFTGTASISTTTSTEFVSPLLQKDEQYTFYLSDYPGLSTGSYTGDISIYYGSETGTTCDVGTDVISLELTLIYDTDNKIKRWIADGGDKFGTGGASDDIYGGSGGPLGTPPTTTTFSCKTSNITFSSTSYPNPKVLFVRSFFLPTKIGFVGSATLKPQGKTINSEAKSTSTGVTKKVKLFQSYTQIPADFFVTSF